MMRNRFFRAAAVALVPAAVLTAGPVSAHEIFYVGYAKGVEGTISVDGVTKNVLLAANYMSCLGKPKEETVLAVSTNPSPDIGVSAKNVKTYTLGRANVASAEADAAEASVKVPGLNVYATGLSASAEASCNPANGRISREGNATVGLLKINGETRPLTAAPNQTFEVPGFGRVIVNEQTSFGREFRVTALRVIIDNPGARTSGDVHISRVRARINECNI